jgi:diguanylate cyclase (GGDEF)-like protein/PAS domain S-box-containing protein
LAKIIDRGHHEIGPGNSGFFRSRRNVAISCISVIITILIIAYAVHISYLPAITASTMAAWPVKSICLYIAPVALALGIGCVVLTRITIGPFRQQQDQNLKLKQIAAALRETERRLTAFALMSADWSWEQGADLRFVKQSNIPLTSLPTDVGKTRWEFADTAMNPHRWDLHKADLAARRPFRDFRWERIQTDGKRRYMSTSGDPIFSDAGVFLGYHGTGRDITADVGVAEELRLAKEQAEAANHANADLVTAVSFANDAIIGLGSDRLIKTWNPAAERIYGLKAENVIGRDIVDLWHSAEQASLAADLREVSKGKVITNLETVCRHPDGYITHVSISAAPVIASDGAVTGLIVTACDITARKRSEERILHLAHHDALTGLPNRALLHDRISQALKLAAHTLAVLVLDLDRFKTINDGFGHAAGDRLLVLVTDRLKGLLRASDTLARIGGDEFVVLQTDVEPSAAGELAQRLIEELSEQFELNHIQMRIGASVGIALYPADGENADVLLKNADTALHRAKADRHGTFRFFEAQMDLQLRERWALEQDLRLAIGTDQLQLLYQPIFASSTRTVTGFEALLRWHHPVLGSISPAYFIPIAEETELILTIGAWVLEEACRTAAGWAKPKRIAVNLSAAQLRNAELAAQVADVLVRTGLPARLLELEVTETVLISNHSHASDTMRALRALGCADCL